MLQMARHESQVINDNKKYDLKKEEKHTPDTNVTIRGTSPGRKYKTRLLLILALNQTIT